MAICAKLRFKIWLILSRNKFAVCTQKATKKIALHHQKRLLLCCLASILKAILVHFQAKSLINLSHQQGLRAEISQQNHAKYTTDKTNFTRAKLCF